MTAAKRLVRAVRLILHDDTIPRPLRWLATIGLLPIPGPIDEAALIVALLVLATIYPAHLRTAWKDADG